MEFQPDLIECIICNLRFNGVIPCATHLLTKAHQRKKLESISLAESSPEVGIINLIFQKMVPQAVEDPTQLLYCELCDVKTTDVEPMLAHYKSRKHAKNLNFHAETKKHVDFQTYHNRLLKLAEEVNQRNKGIFLCRICSVVMSTKLKYNIHLTSKIHYKSLNAMRSAKIIAKFHRDLRWKRDGTFVESSELVQFC